MTKKKGLGRGLSALLEDPGTDITSRHVQEAGHARVAGGVATIPVAQIEPNPFQPRTTFAPEAIPGAGPEHQGTGHHTAHHRAQAGL
jgi:ParB family chromosome partitioning protein